jgi:two-component system nitrate/nitrite response regulator NarL
MLAGAGLAVRRELGSAVIVAIKNDLLRSGVERMLHAIGVTDVRARSDLHAVSHLAPVGCRILIALLSEVDDAFAARLRAAETAGTKVLLLLAGHGDVAELARIGRLGIRGAGFMAIAGLSEATLAATLSRMAHDEVPIPAGLARKLLALVEERAAVLPRPRLTPRETEALGLMVEGLSNKQIGRRLEISEHGAKRLVANILAKLGCANRTLAVARALREGLHERPGHRRNGH